MDKIEEACYRIDELININLTGRAGTRQLLEALKRREKGSMCFSAAKRLADVLSNGKIVLICTGAFIRPWNANETDGPIGAAVLARSLSVGFGAKPIILVDEGIIKLMSSTCRALELNIVSDDKQLRRFANTVEVCSFPNDNEKAKTESKRILNELKPAAIITIEVLGMNKKGIYHNMAGVGSLEFPEFKVAKFDFLLEEAKGEGILTLGIGDGGNEIGMGNVKDAVRKYVPFGKKCKCPCGAGIAAERMVDSLVVASVSNWGAYGISASLSKLLNNHNILHSDLMERNAIESCAAEGGFDGTTGICQPSVDGMPMEVHIGLVNMLNVIIRR